jgi:hypothetical protein
MLSDPLQNRETGIEDGTSNGPWRGLVDTDSDVTMNVCPRPPLR